MHPAPSVILFTTMSGVGFGLLAFLALGTALPAGWVAFLWWGLGYALAVGGLMASTFHLGNPQRFLLAFTQWRTSWLSREAWASVVTLLLLAPVALSDWLGLGWSRVPGLLGALGAVVTVGTTSMIYAQLKTVPRWNFWTTPALFFGFALTGGALLSGQGWLAFALLPLLSLLLLVAFQQGDGRFKALGATMESATGLGSLGRVSIFEPAHTAGNYLLREMIFHVGRKHAARLRLLAFLFAGMLPAAVLVWNPYHPVALVVAALLHLGGALAARWLFFAEAEHVVGLYYGKR